MGGVLLALLVVVVLVLTNKGTGDPAANAPINTAGVVPPISGAATSQPLTTAEAEGVWRGVRKYVVEVIAETPDGVNSGSGVIVDSRGWIATSRRLIQGATRVTILPAPDSTGRVGASADATAVLIDNPQQDLAVLVADGLHVSDAPLLLQREITAGAHITCGAPNSARGSWMHLATPITGSKVSLPGDVKFELMSAANTPDLQWITYPGELPVSATGGPLVTRSGEIAGINLAASSALGQVYTLHATHIASSLASVDPKRVIRRLGPDKLASTGGNPVGNPGIKTSLAAASGAEEDPENPFGSKATIDDTAGIDRKPPAKPPGATPGSSPEDPTVVRLGKPEVEVMEATAENIRKTLAAAEGFDLAPETSEQYQVLQQLSRMITEASKPGADAKATSEANAAVQVLSTSEWPTAAGIKKTHELAVDSFGRGEKGVFVYGVMHGIIGTEDGSEMLFFRIPETRDFVAVPAKDNLRAVPQNSEWLLTGAEITGRGVQVPMKEGDTTRMVIPVLLDSIYIISKPVLPRGGP